MDTLLQWIANEEQQLFSDAWLINMLEDTLRYDYNSIYVVCDRAGQISCESIGACKADVSELRGYMIINDIAGTSELLRIGVDLAYRQQGFATVLMDFYFNQIQCNQYLLEVRASNLGARALYEKLGYNVIATRKNYYSNPTEDGMIYERLV